MTGFANPPRHGEGDRGAVEGQPRAQYQQPEWGCPSVTPAARHLPVPGRMSR